MTNLEHLYLIPLAGFGKRFKDEGFHLPKQMLKAGGISCLEWSLKSLDLANSEVMYVVRKEQFEDADFVNYLMRVTDAKVSIKVLDQPTRGSLESCYLAVKDLDNDFRLSIFTGDVYFQPVYSPKSFDDPMCEGWLLSFKSNSNGYSYVRCNQDGSALETAEKVVISDQALVGVYGFSSTKSFLQYAQKELSDSPKFGAEYYIAPLYNRFIGSGSKVSVQPVSEMHVFGTPKELEFFKKFVIRSMGSKKIGLCSDHSGFQVKNQLKEILNILRIEYIDFGTHHPADCDYNEFISIGIDALQSGAVDYIFSSCRSGQGVNIAAANHPDVIAALIYDLESAGLAVKHNAANFFSFPEKIWEEGPLMSAVKAILDSRFEGGRHQGRLMKTREARNASF